jgi:hypothetical protein
MITKRSISNHNAILTFSQTWLELTRLYRTHAYNKQFFSIPYFEIFRKIYFENFSNATQILFFLFHTITFGKNYFNNISFKLNI